MLQEVEELRRALALKDAQLREKEAQLSALAHAHAHAQAQAQAQAQFQTQAASTQRPTQVLDPRASAALSLPALAPAVLSAIAAEAGADDEKVLLAEEEVASAQFRASRASVPVRPAQAGAASFSPDDFKVPANVLTHARTHARAHAPKRTRVNARTHSHARCVLSTLLAV